MTSISSLPAKIVIFLFLLLTPPTVAQWPGNTYGADPRFQYYQASTNNNDFYNNYNGYSRYYTGPSSVNSVYYGGGNAGAASFGKDAFGVSNCVYACVRLL